MQQSKLAKRLHAVYRRYHSPRYLGLDPLVCVRRFRTPREREVVGLIAAALSYGRVESIIASVERVIAAAGGDPLAYVTATTFARKRGDLAGFRHRFNDGFDVAVLLEALKTTLRECGTLEQAFVRHLSPHDTTVRHALQGFVTGLRRRGSMIMGKSRRSFEYLLPSPEAGSACKRMNMFLRWMVREDDGIDLGVWRRVPKSLLVMPVDAHVARAAREFRLTRRRTADWRMAEEIAAALKKVDPDDPVKYDFSLCRHGMVRLRKGSYRGR